MNSTDTAFMHAFLVTIMLSNAVVNIAVAWGSCCSRKPLMEVNLNHNCIVMMNSLYCTCKRQGYLSRKNATLLNENRIINLNQFMNTQ